MTCRVCITCYEGCGLSFVFFFNPPCSCFGKTLDICTWNETVGKDYICIISLVWFLYSLSLLLLGMFETN